MTSRLCLVLLIGATSRVFAGCAGHRVADAGFWFEEVTYASPRLGGPVTPAELDTIASIARSELTRAFFGLGGHGAVSFFFLASGAVAYAPREADRAAIHSTNVRSYEYASAARPEQYFGDMQWDLAWPLLHRRIGS